MTRYYEHRQTGKRYIIVGPGADEGTVRLKGQHREFDEPDDAEKFANIGYVLREGDPATDELLGGGTAPAHVVVAAAPAVPAAPAAPAVPAAPPVVPSAPPVPPAAPAVPSVPPAVPSVPSAPPAVPAAPPIPPAVPTVPAAPPIPPVPGA